MKKHLSIWLTALLLCLTLGLFACSDGTPEDGDGGDNDNPTAVQYTYTLTADEGISVTASAGGGTALVGGAKVDKGAEVTLTATVQEGTVRVYVNDGLVSLPHTFTVNEDFAVRAELYFDVTAKVSSTYELALADVTLTEDGYDAELNDRWEHTARVRSGNSVTFVASATGFATVQKTVTATENESTELVLDTPVMTTWGVIKASGSGYAVVRDETLETSSAGSVQGYTAYEAISDKHWVFSYKAKDIVGGAWDIVSLGALLDASGSTSMNLYYSVETGVKLETLTVNPQWVQKVYDVQSSFDLAEALGAARKDGDGYILLEYVRDNDMLYLFVNGSYVLCADVNDMGAATDISDRATSFGIFTRANMGASVYDVEYSVGEESVTARLGQGKVNIDVTGENATVTAPEKAYDGQKLKIAFTPNDDYMLDTVTVDGDDVTDNVTTESGKYVFTVYATEGLEIEISCKPAVVMYDVTGHIDVSTYDIAPTDITATASNHQIVTVDNDYNYTVKAEAGELTLTFAAENFTTVTETVNVTDGDNTRNIAMDEPVLTLYLHDSSQKTGKNTYDFDGSGAFIPSNFMAAASRYWTAEAKVHIKETYETSGYTDWGVGFTVGSYNAAVNICFTGGNYFLEAIAVDNGYGIFEVKRNSVDSSVTAAMLAAAQTDGYVTLKAVRVDTAILFYVNGAYAGSLPTLAYGSANVDDNQWNAGALGLYARGGVKCTFSDVRFDLDVEAAENAAASAPKYGQETLAITNATQAQDGSISVDTWMGAHYAAVAEKYWVMETKMHVTITDSTWFYAGISVNNAGWNNIEFNYVNGNTTLKTFTNQEVATLTVSEDVDLSAAMLAATQDGGYIALKVVRLGSKFYVFVNGVLASETTLENCGLAADLGEATFGLHATGADYTCKFYDMRYSTNAVVVLNEVKGVASNA